MSVSALCPDCEAGDHAAHVEHWNQAPDGALGGAHCPCDGTCKPSSMSWLAVPGDLPVGTDPVEYSRRELDETGADNDVLEVVAHAAGRAYEYQKGHVNAWPLALAVVGALKRAGYLISVTELREQVARDIEAAADRGGPSAGTGPEWYHGMGDAADIARNGAST